MENIVFKWNVIIWGGATAAWGEWSRWSVVESKGFNRCSVHPVSRYVRPIRFLAGNPCGSNVCKAEETSQPRTASRFERIVCVSIVALR